MTENQPKPENEDISIWGAGCAGLSLARALAPHLASGRISAKAAIYGALTPAIEHSHIWGFWQTGWLAEAAQLSRKSWQYWQIITPFGRVTQKSERFAYHGLESAVWLKDCLKQAEGQLAFKQGAPEPGAGAGDGDGDGQRLGLGLGLVLDSRTPDVPENSLLQHFKGWEIKTDKAVFDANILTLMDFRCDQSRGIHFIYLLPFSENTALVESTFFSEQTEDSTFYEQAIQTYLKDIYQIEDFQILREEAGCIPMNFLSPRDPSLLAIGANGGCVRASSGYAFAFIQKQVQQIARHLAEGQKITQIPVPHRAVDRWLDRVFLAVLKAHPEAAPDIFLRMAKALSGDELAKFMSGLADLSIYAKLILAMPKQIFIAQIIPAFKRSKIKRD